MAQSGHVHHHPDLQYGVRKTGNCKISPKIEIKDVVSPLPDKISVFNMWFRNGSEKIGLGGNFTPAPGKVVRVKSSSMHSRHDAVPCDYDAMGILRVLLA